MSNIGHNNPPSAFDDVEKLINDHLGEARHHLDGDDITTEAQARDIANLQNILLKGKKTADNLRKEEAKPFDDGKKAVQEKFKPLIKKAELGIDTCRNVLTPFLEAKEAARLEEAAELRRIADEAIAAAAAEIQSIPEGHLEAREEAEDNIEAAKKSDYHARHVENKKANAKNDAGKAIGLKTSYEVEIDSLALAMGQFIEAPELPALLIQLAKRQVTSGKREIPGFKIIEVKKAA